MGTRSGAAARTARVFTPWGLRVQVAGTPGGARAAGGGAAGAVESWLVWDSSQLFFPQGHKHSSLVSGSHSKKKKKGRRELLEKLRIPPPSPGTVLTSLHEAEEVPSAPMAP